MVSFFQMDGYLKHHCLLMVDKKKHLRLFADYSVAYIGKHNIVK